MYMREIIKNNKTVYDYKTHKISYDVTLSAVLYCISILLMLLSFFISYIYIGNAPTVVAGVGISSLIFNTASMIVVVYDIYMHDNYSREVGVMLILQLILFSIWIFIII